MSKRLTLSEMAAELRVSPKTFRRYLTKYKIPHLRIGRQMLFDRSEVEACLRVEPREPTVKIAVPKTQTNQKGRFAERLGLA